MSVRTLLYGEVYYHGRRGVEKGFVFINGEKIGDVGSEPLPEYELAELVLKYEKPALVLHGFSALVPGVEFPYRGLGLEPRSMSPSALERFVQASVSASIANGVTLPIFMDTDDCQVSSSLGKLGVQGIVISRQPCERPGVLNILIARETLVFKGVELGVFSQVVCKPEEVEERCLILDTRGEHSRSVQAWLSKSPNPRLALNLLLKPYKLLELDNGLIERGSISDVLVYDLSDPVISAPLKAVDPLTTVMRGNPQLVFVRGEVAFEKGEHLMVEPPSIIQLLPGE